MTGEDYVLSGIDLDNQRDPVSGELDERAQQILLAAESYAEVSPSGTGIKIFGIGDIGTDKRLNCTAGLEIYSGGRFFTVTGQAVNAIRDLMPLDDAARIARSLFKVDKPQEGNAVDGATREGGRNNTLTSVAGQMCRMGWEGPRISVALEAINQRECTPPLAPAEVAGIAHSVARYAPGETDKVQLLPDAFPLLWYATMDRAAPCKQLVKGLLLAQSLIVLYGDSNSGKSFFLLDLALHIAAGRRWRGQKVEAGMVVWICGEGAIGMRNRLAAARKAHPELRDALPLAVLPMAVNFMDAASVNVLIATIRAAEAECGHKAALIVVDTLARAMAGADENAAADMGENIASADRIRRETGAAVAYIHHSGKDASRGARGSGALRAAVDTEILIEGQADVRTATVSKQRELPGGQRYAFELVTIDLGSDDDGEPITSAVVLHREAAPNKPKVTGKCQRELLAELERRHMDGEQAWTEKKLREIARELGQHKNSARDAVHGLRTLGYLTMQLGGSRLAYPPEAGPKDRNGNEITDSFPDERTERPGVSIDTPVSVRPHAATSNPLEG